MDAYSVLLQKMTKEELEERITRKIAEMNGFLTREAAVRIIANETGAKQEERKKLSEIGEGANQVSAIAKVARVLPLQRFENGKKMRKIVLSDEGGERELKLWNSDADLANSLHSGDLLELKGVYCKNNGLGLGYSGELIVLERASFADLGNLNELEGINVNARGYVENAGELKEYERGGQKRRFFSFSISDGKNSARVVMWGNVERGKGLFPGAEVKIESAKVKDSELHMNSESRLMVKRKKAGIGGKIEDLAVSDSKLSITINGEKHEFAKEEALKILNANVAEGIKLETVVELKKNDFIGKEMFIEIKEGKVAGVSLKSQAS